MCDDILSVLVGEVQKSLGILERLHVYVSEFVSERMPALGRTTDSALILAGATLFLRVSQAFENTLAAYR